jgi:pimeloyl-[acyl-carrier protein] methyl ester esterase
MSLFVESVGDGPAVVLLHGWAMHSGLWAPLVERLADRYRLHLVDLPGHGRSPPIASYTLDAMAEAVASACRPLINDDQQLDVLGWSLGGAIATRWALREPDAVAKLILVCTSPCFVRRPDWPHAMEEQTLRRFGDELSTAYTATLQRFVALQVQGSDHARSVLVQLREHLFDRGQPSRDALLGTLQTLAASDTRSDAAAIAHPSLVIAGERDALVPSAAVAWLAAALPKGRYQPLPHAAHAPFLSHPEVFVAALDDFLCQEAPGG